MTATERISAMLDERGKEHRVWPSGLVIWHDEGSWVYEYSPPKGDDDYWGGILHATLRHCTPEQAIEATLGETPTPPPPTPPKQPPYDELIESLRRDWDIEASWDGLRRFWYVGLTDEGVRKRDEREATLRELVHCMAYCMQHERECDECAMNGADGTITALAGCDGLRDRLRELGIEVEE